MKLKEVDRTANIAWSPNDVYPIYLATGTAAQQLDSSFSTSATLELYEFDVNTQGLDMPIKASVSCESRFFKLVWGSHDIGSEKDVNYPSGVIVSGCEGGLMQVFDAAKIFTQPDDAIILTKTKHTGAVRSLDFNPFRSYLVASGASDSEIFIWDLNNPKTPMSPGNRAQPPDDVTHLAWNKQVEHILASTFSSRCVVWDLRKNEPIIKLSDNSKIQYKVVEWHPSVATQMCLASESDSNPVIQLWDLRYATAPLKVLSGHERGVLGLSWCTRDPEILISCGRDSRLLCWNPNYQHPGYELLAEIPTTTNWTFDVSICPRNPLAVASASFDGRVSVFGLGGGVQTEPVSSSKLADSFPGMDMSMGQTPVPTQKPAVVQLRDAPKWLKRPFGASFVFGGKLVKFENSKLQAQTQQGDQTIEKRLVTISQVVTEPKFLESSKKLETALESGDLCNYCEEKAAETSDPSEMEIWKFLQASFSEEPRKNFVSLLGFDNEEIQNKIGAKVGQSDETIETNSLADSFSNLGKEGHDGTGGISFDFLSPDKKTPSGLITPDPDRLFHIPTDESTEGLLNQALLSGNIDQAVELCLEDSRWADALLLASIGSPELMRKAQIKYFQRCENEASNMIRAVVTRDLQRLVERCELSCWKEALATLLTYAEEPEFLYLAEVLGKRLEASRKEDLKQSALLVYVTSGNLNRLVESWADEKNENMETPAGLQEVVEKVMVLKKAAEVRGGKASGISSGPLATKLVEYSSLLASQGYLQPALNYLGEGNDPSMNYLRERLQYALGYAKPGRAPRSRDVSINEPMGQMKRPSYPSAGSVNNSAIPFRRYSGNEPQQSQFPLQSQQPSMYNPPVAPPPAAQGPPHQAQVGFPTRTPSVPSVPSFVPSAPPQTTVAPQQMQFPGHTHGWNDPPLLSKAKPKAAVNPSSALDPITHPIFGAAPPPEQPAPPLQSGMGYGHGDPYPRQTTAAPPPALYPTLPQPYGQQQGQGQFGQSGQFQMGGQQSSFGQNSAYNPQSGMHQGPPGPPPQTSPYNHSSGMHQGPPGPPPVGPPPTGPPPSTPYTFGGQQKSGGMGSQAPMTFNQNPISHVTPLDSFSAFNPAPMGQPTTCPFPPPPSSAVGPPPQKTSVPPSFSSQPGNTLPPRKISPPSMGPSGIPPPMASGPPPVQGFPPSQGINPVSGQIRPSPTGTPNQPFGMAPPPMDGHSPLPPPMVVTPLPQSPPSAGPPLASSGNIPSSQGHSQQQTSQNQYLPMGGPTMAQPPSFPPSGHAMAPPMFSPSAVPVSMMNNPTFPPPNVSGSGIQTMSGGGNHSVSSGMSSHGPPGGPPMNSYVPNLQNDLYAGGLPSMGISNGVPSGGTSISERANLIRQAKEVAPPKHKGPIPEEHKELVEVLERLRSECCSFASLPQMKRKLEDVARKIEVFEDKLREGSLSTNTINGLHSMVDALKRKDYPGALAVHTQLVTAGNFSEISSFLPAIKVLVQSATQLGVYL